MPYTPVFPAGVANLPTTDVTDTAANAGNLAGNPLGLSPWLNGNLAELQAVQNFVLTRNYGDIIAPASPTVYDDEFPIVGGVTTPNAKWSISGTATNASCNLVSPNFLQQAIAFGATGQISIKAQQALTNPVLSTSWLFQFKLRFILSCFQVTAANTGTALEWAIGITKTTATTKGFWLFGNTTYNLGATGTQPVQWFSLTVWRGQAGNTQLNACSAVVTGEDLRVQMGVQATNLVCNVSNDGYNWVNLYSEPYATGTTFVGLIPTQLTLQLDNQNTANTSNAGFVAWDYCRCLHL